MKHIRPRNLWYILAVAGAVLFYGCSKPAPEPDNGIAAANAQLIQVRQQLADIDDKLNQLAARRIILPWTIERETTDKDGRRSVVVASAPDIRSAIGFQLKAAGALVGNDKVVAFFEDMGSDIRKAVVPVDLGGVLDKKARELSGKKINSLLNQ